MHGQQLGSRGDQQDRTNRQQVGWPCDEYNGWVIKRGLRHLSMILVVRRLILWSWYGGMQFVSSGLAKNEVSVALYNVIGACAAIKDVAVIVVIVR